MAKDAKKNELMLSSSGTVKSNRSNNFASVCSKRGQKGINQDCAVVWEEFGCQEDTIFCGIFDGHGPWGHIVAKRVREWVPPSLLCNWQKNLIASTSTEELDMDQLNTNIHHQFDIWKQSYLKTYSDIDLELKQHPGIDSFRSGTTALTIIKQGEHLVIANVGDSRAVLATTSDDGNLVPLQLTVDFKPNIPGFSSPRPLPMSNSLFLSFPLSFPPTLSHVRAFNLRSTVHSPVTFSAPTSYLASHRKFLYIPSLTMHSNPKLAATQLDVSQLDDLSDFEKLLSPSGHISICGFGSLLSEKSARSTFPNLLNFRVAKLNGFRRVFAHVAPIFFDRGIAKPETKEISSLSVEPCEGETLIVTVFEIQKSEIPAFMDRELEFRFLAVLPETLDGEPFANPGVLCARYSDKEFFQIRCKGSKDIYFQHYGRYNIDKIWRDDILPCRVYLRHCVLAAKNLGDIAYNNFLDHTFLGDRTTTIRTYLATTGSGIMEEEPPESLKSRYGG
ncbi:phosphatase 2C (PP2C)-like protein [Corchorus capsularis]|uniref:Phosphatase 2C (PP2C)-like protein n=1 Tax=Corchorus capsularis TaxID=210143 RepID=A0A1R3G6C2_COCAP|nr:phosphatase 2C (PP2C)-like protein [Corchorus capsularis]